MKVFSMLAVVLALGLAVATGDADAAKRFGGGKSSGMQRESVSAPQSPSSAPSSAAATSAAQRPMAAPASPAQPKRSWMGPLAGLAAGLGLAALAAHFGFGEELASMLMIGLLVMAALALVAFIMRRKAASQAPASGGLQYATAGAPSALPEHRPGEPAMFSPGSAQPVLDDSHQPGNIPADFDVAGFVRNAKVNFIRLQAANDAGNLEDIREFTTPEMFAEIKMDISERGNAKQETDVLEIDAQVLDVSEESSRYIVSVRFTGLIREEKDAAAERVDEVWHMIKPRDGRTGWVLAGIQQMQ